MPWIKAYNVEHDLIFQTEISGITARNIRRIDGLDGISISDEKFNGVEVRPEEYRSWPENQPSENEG